MKLHTCSEVISFTRGLENESLKFYQGLAARYYHKTDLFCSLAEENEKNIMNVESVYYNVISDAIEGCFAFNLNPEEYKFPAVPIAKAAFREHIEQALEMEVIITRYYTEAASQAKTLLADLSRSFVMIVRKRGTRREKLLDLLHKEET